MRFRGCVQDGWNSGGIGRLGASEGSSIIVSKSGSEIGENLHPQRRIGTTHILLAGKIRITGRVRIV